MLNHPVLRQDLLKGRHAIDHVNAPDDEWADWWLKWPIDRWTDKQNGQHWFKLRDGRLELSLKCSQELRPALESMTEELVDWRLAAYIKNHKLTDSDAGQQSFEAKCLTAAASRFCSSSSNRKCPTAQSAYRSPLARWQYVGIQVRKDCFATWPTQSAKTVISSRSCYAAGSERTQDAPVLISKFTLN